jgi:hypothetical protein
MVVNYYVSFYFLFLDRFIQMIFNINHFSKQHFKMNVPLYNQDKLTNIEYYHNYLL